MSRFFVFFTALIMLTRFASGAAVKVSATIDVQHPTTAIPESFMGLSREWRVFVAPDEGPASAVHPAYLRLLENLCAFNDKPLCIRVGGNSADGIRESPSADRWKQIGEIFKATRTPVIINLNLQREDAELDKAMVSDALKYLPKEAIMTFELGNEPDGWAGRYRPKEYTFEQYLPVFNRIAKQLVPALTPGLAGPAYAHAAPPQVIKDFLAAEPGLINLVTVHSYRFDPKSNPKPERLLDDRDSHGYAARLVDGIRAAHDAGLPIRLTESGSAWSGGVAGFSDTFAASLWTLDVFFEFAKAGLDGIHPHGGGLGHYTPIREDVDKQTKKAIITAAAPYYGMLVFAEATAHGARFLPVATEGDNKTKIWATLDRTGTTRVVIINRNLNEEAEVEVRLQGSGASIKTLRAPMLTSTDGISFAGQTYDGSADGRPVGTLEQPTVKAENGVLRLQVKPVSAVLATIQP